MLHLNHKKDFKNPAKACFDHCNKNPTLTFIAGFRKYIEPELILGIQAKCRKKSKKIFILI
jgi:hypothetical protein